VGRACTPKQGRDVTLHAGSYSRPRSVVEPPFGLLGYRYPAYDPYQWTRNRGGSLVATPRHLLLRCHEKCSRRSRRQRGVAGENVPDTSLLPPPPSGQAQPLLITSARAPLPPSLILPATVTRGPANNRQSATGAGNDRWDLFLVGMAGWALVSITRTHAVVSIPEALRPGLILAGLSLVLYFLQRDPARRFGTARHRLTGIAGFFFVWAVVTTPFALYIGRAFSTVSGSFLRTFLFFLLLVLCIRSVKDSSRMVNVLGMGAVIFAVGALGSAVRGVRIGGLDPNDSAMLMAAMLPLILFSAIRSRGALLKWLYGAGFLLSAAAIVHTGSRGGFLALAAVVVYTVVVMRPIRPAVRGLVAVGVAVGAIGAASGDYWERVRSITELDDGYSHGDIGGRKNTWNRGLEYAAANPITGVGINNFTVAEARHPIIAGIIASGRGMKFSAPHSIWVQVGAELGAPGFLAFVAMFIVSMLSLFQLASRGARAPPGSRDRRAGEVAAALLGSLIALAVGGSFLTHAYSPMLWGVFGLSIGLLKVARLPARGAPSATVPVARWRRSVERRPGEVAASPGG